MTARLLVCLLGGVLLLALSGPADAGPTPPAQSSGSTLAQVVEREIDRLEREFRRLQEGAADGKRASAQDALEELHHMRSDLERWMARSEQEPYKDNLDRFLRDLEMRLGRLSVELKAPSSRPAHSTAGGEKRPVPGRTAERVPAAAMRMPANDDCGSATVIGDGFFGGDTTAATVDGEASCGASVVGADVWFRYVAAESGDVMFNTLGSSFDTVLSLHAGCPGTPANQLDCNDDRVGTQSELVYSLGVGDEVLIRVGGFAGDYGAYLLNTGPPAEIAGTVTEADTGLGLADVYVDVIDGTGSWQGQDRTTASGAYSIGGLRQGIHYVKASKHGYQAELFDDIECPDYCDPTTGTPIPLGLGDLSRADLALARAGTIEGSITDAATGDPLAGIDVQIYSGTGSRTGSDETDASGAYSVSGLAPGSYFARAESDSGYLDELYDDIACPGYCDPTTGTAIVVGTGATVQADFALQLGGAIGGRIADVSTARPIPDVRVDVIDQEGTFVASARSDLAGRYVVSGLTTGPYFALTRAFDYLNQVYDGLDCPPGCDATGGTPIAVVVGSETTGVDFALLREAAFSGLIVDDAVGVPVDDVTVDAWNDQGDWVGSGRSDQWGVYVVGGLPAGSFHATTSNYSGYLDELWDDLPCVDGGCDPTAGTPIAVAAAMTATGFDFALTFGGSISGSVYELSQGVGLGAWVRLWDSGGNEVDSDYASGGSYSMLGLGSGTYFVSADASDYHEELYDDLPCPAGCDPTSGTPVAVTAGVDTAGIDFGLCGRPTLQAHFPPSGDPDSWIDGCRVQVGGMASSYHPACPPVVRIHWDWGDGKQGDADFPASHMYEPGPEWRIAWVSAYDALDLGSEQFTKQLRLWDCLTPGSCGYPDERQLYNLFFDSTEVIQACTTIALGPSLVVVAPADVTILAGDSVALANGVRFEGGLVSIGTDPALQP